MAQELKRDCFAILGLYTTALQHISRYFFASDALLRRSNSQATDHTEKGFAVPGLASVSPMPHLPREDFS